MQRARTLVALLAAALAGNQASRAAAPPSVDLTKEPTLYVVGYAHLDTQWRWMYPQSIREYLPATLQDNFRLFETYPSYIFNFSGSRRYQMMKEYYPEDYARLKAYVAAGRWFPCGSSVDENDANVPSAESFVRHILYGNRFFRREFGVASDEYMLPDCFGFPAALPSLLAHCGIIGFSTQKLTWGSAVGIPFKIGVWEGPDGRSVIAALDPGSYVGEILENLAESDGWKERINANGQASGVFADYHYFGTGDRGGAPVEKSVELLEKSIATKGPVRVISSQADWLFKAIPSSLREKLPHYKGELLLTEHSAGSITSQAFMKRCNRKNELLADAAERASLAAWWLGGADYPAEKLEKAWTLLLGSQMHDILPGTSHPTAYDYSWNDELLAANQFAAVLEHGASVVARALDTRGDGTSLVLFNPLSVEREDVVEAELPGDAASARGVTVVGPDGRAVAAQICGPAAQGVRIAFVARLPSVAFVVYHAKLTNAEQPDSTSLRVAEKRLENDRYVVTLNDDGDVASIRDKSADRELLAGPVRMGLHYENPRSFPAWNQDWADRQLPPKEFVSGPAAFRVVERGPARVAVEVVRQLGPSTFIQQIRLCSGEAGQRVEFVNRIDWAARERSLRVAFPLTVSNEKASYDVQVGVIERGNNHEKRYENPSHQWFDLTDAKGDYGVTVMNDCKYGSDKPADNTVRLTLLHTPGTRGGFGDQATQDVGRHRVLFALAGHKGDWREGRSAVQAARLNQPIIAFRASPHEGSLGKSFSLLRISSEDVRVSAMKKAEDGDDVIVRLRELTGRAAKGVQVALAGAITAAREVDGQERPIGPAQVRDGALAADLGGFELRAYALKLAAPSASVARPAGAALTLDFDTAVATAAPPRPVAKDSADGKADAKDADNSPGGDAGAMPAQRDAGGTSAPQGGETPASQGGAGRMLAAQENAVAMDAQGRSYPAEQLPAKLVVEDAAFVLGPCAAGAKNALTCRGQSLKLPAGSFDRLCLLWASSGGDVQTTIEIDGKGLPVRVRDWTGFVGRWDRRLWDGEVPELNFGWSNELAGIEPGHVNPEPVAWYCSHHHTRSGDAYYQYCYLYKSELGLPAGAKDLRLPNDQRIKLFAACVVGGGGRELTAAAPLFDTLEDHVQDAPRIVPDGGSFSDAVDVRIEPRLYWRPGSVRYTTDGSTPTADAAAYHGPFSVSRSAVIRAAVIDAGGNCGPVASATLDVNDVTPPSVTSVGGGYQSTEVRVRFSEPVAESARKPENYTLEPAVAVKSAHRGDDSRTIVLDLAAPPETGRAYRLTMTGIEDISPARNTAKSVVKELLVKGPVYRLAEVSSEQFGSEIRDVTGLPVKAGDAWTLNMWVRISKQPHNRTVIAGFGKCEQSADGVARYLAKFANGVRFWSHDRDVDSRTPLDLDRWQMLTATYDGRTLRLYKDGRKIGQSEVGLADDENVIRFAPPDPWENKRRFDGQIREFSIWDSAFSDQAVQALRDANPVP